jgi:hypothetical protein
MTRKSPGRHPTGDAPAPDDTDRQLRALLERQARAACEDAVRSGGEISAERVDALARLARLVDLQRAAQPPPARPRWPVLIALGLTFLIVGLLLSIRVSETEVELDLALSEVGFSLPAQQQLAGAMKLSSLGVSGLRLIEVPRTRDRDAMRVPPADGGPVSLRLSIVGEGEPRGTLGLETPILPAGTRVRVRHTGLPREYRLSLAGAELEMRAPATGRVRLELSGGGSEPLDFTAPKAFLLQSGTGEVDVDLTFAEAAGGALSPQLAASNLSFSRINEDRDDDRTRVYRVSTILTGTVYFQALDGQELKVRPGEVVQFERTQGEIRTLRLEDDHIDLKYHGRVCGMTVGSGENRRSLMPTWLEWLRARHGLSLFWGTALYLFGLIAGVLRWLGRPA